MSDAVKTMLEKPVVDPKTALSVAPGAPVDTSRRFRFQKTLNPDEAVVAGGREIKFYRAVHRTGAKARKSVFETKDAALAQAIRDAAKANPSLYVFEMV